MVDKLIGEGHVTPRMRTELIIPCGADEAKKARVPQNRNIPARKGALLKKLAVTVQYSRRHDDAGQRARKKGKSMF